MVTDKNNYEVINCPEDDEYRVYCDICENLYIERFYNSHLKSQTHTKNIREREQSKKCFQIILYL